MVSEWTPNREKVRAVGMVIFGSSSIALRGKAVAKRFKQVQKRISWRSFQLLVNK